MSALPLNVERIRDGRKFRYIGYCGDGFAFRIEKSASGFWSARPSHASAGSDHRRFTHTTLAKLAAKLGNSSALNQPVVE